MYKSSTQEEMWEAIKKVEQLTKELEKADKIARELGNKVRGTIMVAQSTM